MFILKDLYEINTSNQIWDKLSEKQNNTFLKKNSSSHPKAFVNMSVIFIGFLYIWSCQKSNWWFLLFLLLLVSLNYTIQEITTTEKTQLWSPPDPGQEFKTELLTLLTLSDNNLNTTIHTQFNVWSSSILPSRIQCA